MSFSGSAFQIDEEPERSGFTLHLTSNSSLAQANGEVIQAAFNLVISALEGSPSVAPVSKEDAENGRANVIIQLMDESSFRTHTQIVTRQYPIDMSSLNAFYVEVEAPYKESGQGMIYVNIEDVLLKDGEEHPFAFSRLVAVLAHELYGNAIRRYMDGSSDHSLAGYYRSEIAAYSRGIELIQKISNQLRRSPETSAIADKVESQIEEERQRQASWMRALEGLQSQSDSLCGRSLDLNQS